MRVLKPNSFEEWRELARELLQSETSPADVAFREASAQRDLFDAIDTADTEPEPSNTKRSPVVKRVPKAFLELAKLVGCHRDQERWNRLYRVLWRLTHGEPHLLEVSTDEEVHQLLMMQKAVTRDRHKMKAFVRFRRVETPEGEHFIAWHRPDHRIVRLTAPFFARRFPSMNWSILTPHESVSWDQAHLQYGPGVPASQAPAPDELEHLWKTYYGAIFNPARIKLKAMIRELPRRHWPTLPETEIIPDLLSQAPQRVQEMLDRQEGFAQSANDFLPDRLTYEDLKTAAVVCQGCDLHGPATQTVFGEGPLTAKLMIVGEQPGDQEDREGRPFVGPAGQLLDEVLTEVGISRESIYLTNAVKHFKFIPKGTRRLHKRPGVREVSACEAWLQAEAALVQPQVLLCLGVTAAQQIIGRDFQLTKQHGQVLCTPWCAQTIATFHPANILRQPDSQKRLQLREQLRDDLERAKALSQQPPNQYRGLTV